MVRGYDWVGSFYPKKQYEVQISGGDDAEEVVNALVLPPLALPTRYWFSWSAVGSADVPAVDNHAWSVISGRYFGLPLDLDTNDDTAMNGNTLLNTYGPSSIGEWGDESPTATESDIPGHSAMDDQASKAEFLHRERFMRLGDGQSVIVNGDEVRYCWYGKSNGKIVSKDNFIDILQPKMIAIGARGDENVDSSDWSDVLTGNFSDFNGMADIMFEYLDQDNPQALGHKATNSQLENWLKLGYSDNDRSSETTMEWTTKLTVEVALYKPKSTRYYSAG